MRKALVPRPWEWSLTPFRHEMGSLFDRFFNEWEPWVELETRRDTYPRVETRVEESEFVVNADLPGVDPKELELSVEEDRLTIKGERKETVEGKKGSYQHREVRYGAFARTLPLPAGVKAEEIKARYEHGVLEVRVPLPAEVVAKKVPIEVTAEEPERIAA